jgi:hypothetical protein
VVPAVRAGLAIDFQRLCSSARFLTQRV